MIRLVRASVVIVTLAASVVIAPNAFAVPDATVTLDALSPVAPDTSFVVSGSVKAIDPPPPQTPPEEGTALKSVPVYVSVYSAACTTNCTAVYELGAKSPNPDAPSASLLNGVALTDQSGRFSLTIEGLREGSYSVVASLLPAPLEPARSVALPKGSANRALSVKWPTPPTTTLSKSPSGWISAVPEFAFTANQYPVTFTCGIARGNSPATLFPECTSPFTPPSGALRQANESQTNLSQDGYRFSVLATRGSDGVSGPAALSAFFGLDMTSPVVTFGPFPYTVADMPQVSVVASDQPTLSPAPTLSCAVVDGFVSSEEVEVDVFEPCSSPYVKAGLAEGEHTLAAVAKDAAGNQSDIRMRYFVIDKTLPDLSIDQLAPTNKARPLVTFGSNDGGASFKCGFAAGVAPLDLSTTPDASLTPCTSSVSPKVNLADGLHHVIVKATDSAGNSTLASMDFLVDGTAPALSLSISPDSRDETHSANRTRLQSANVSWIATDADPGSGIDLIRCFLDGVEVCAGQTASEVALTGLAEGTHELVVRAIDYAGNSTSVSESWTVDRSGPETVIASVLSPTNNKKPSVTFTAADSGPVTATCVVVDGKAPPTGTPEPVAGTSRDCSSKSYQTPIDLVSDGTAPRDFHFRVVTFDDLGNQSTATRNFVIDTELPTASITDGPSSQTTSRSAYFAFHSTDKDATFQCALDPTVFVSAPPWGTVPANSQFTACENYVSGPSIARADRTYNGLTPGQHKFWVRATDTAGNIGYPPGILRPYTWNVL